MLWTRDDGRNDQATAAAALIEERARRAAKSARLKEARLAQEASTPLPPKPKSRVVKKVRRIFVAG
ncbi:hypothetical protein FJW04_17840 [Mesorhizobium sp. B2-7-3]|nr:hypothetical protein FJW04_17840 [Mesorhizobium sp. B2-7-3]